LPREFRSQDKAKRLLGYVSKIEKSDVPVGCVLRSKAAAQRLLYQKCVESIVSAIENICKDGPLQISIGEID
jgi:hypothetical protein